MSIINTFDGEGAEIIKAENNSIIGEQVRQLY